MFAVLIVIWLAFIAIVPPEYQPSSGEKAPVSFKAFADRDVLNKTIEVEKGTNAFDAMQQVATVGYQDFGEMGVLVESINGVKPEENQFWKLFVNGEQAQVGISSITIEEDTTIEWKTEAIEAYTG